MRDARISDEIATAETSVETLVRSLGGLVEHATSQDATAHAALYEHVQGCLESARKQLQRAHEVMLNGDPSDYEEAAR